MGRRLPDDALTKAAVAAQRDQIASFVGHFNYGRYHESLQDLPPADVYFGRGQTVLGRERIKRDTIKQRQLQHQSKAA